MQTRGIQCSRSDELILSTFTQCNLTKLLQLYTSIVHYNIGDGSKVLHHKEDGLFTPPIVYAILIQFLMNYQ